LKILLLTKQSACQVFCVNKLKEQGYLTHVVFESGVSVPSAKRFNNFRSFWRSAKCKLGVVLKRPLSIISFLRNYANYDLYYGNQESHNARVLGGGYKKIPDEVIVDYVKSINSIELKQIVRRIQPDFVIVFGTGWIKKEIIDMLPKQTINMHWGWSPDYRGEGIITALAKEGAKGLGVTIHLLDERIDDGAILFRMRPDIDARDNFYSIGLKLTVIGVELFIKSIKFYIENNGLKVKPEDQAVGKFYGSKYMQQHPEMWLEAWRNLKEQKKENLK